MGKKNVLWNTIGSTSAAFISLFFSVAVTRINGVDDAGIFIYSFSTACLLYIIGAYLGRTYQVTDINNKFSDSDYLFNRIITCILMIIISVCFILIKGYSLYKSSIFILLCTFKAIEAFEEVPYGIIQKNGELYKVGISLTVRSILEVIVFFIVDILTKNLIISCISIIICNILVLYFYDYKNLKTIRYEKTKYNNRTNYNLLAQGFFTFALTFLCFLLVNIPRYAIDAKLSDSLQTIFGILIMPATFMGLLGQYIIQPSLTTFSELIKDNNRKKMNSLLLKLIGIIIAFGVVVIIAAYFLGIPVLELIYGIQLDAYFISFIIIIFGSIFYALNLLLSAVLIAMRKTMRSSYNIFMCCWCFNFFIE